MLWPPSCWPWLWGCLCCEVMRLPAVPGSCCSPALNIAMARALTRSFSSTVLPPQWLQGGCPGPRKGQLPAGSSGGVVWPRQAETSSSLPPLGTLRPGHIPLALGPSPAWLCWVTAAASPAPGPQGLPGCSLALQALGFCCSCPTVPGLGMEQPQETAQRPCDRAGHSQILKQ